MYEDLSVRFQRAHEDDKEIRSPCFYFSAAGRLIHYQWTFLRVPNDRKRKGKRGIHFLPLTHYGAKLLLLPGRDFAKGNTVVEKGL